MENLNVEVKEIDMPTVIAEAFELLLIIEKFRI